MAAATAASAPERAGGLLVRSASRGYWVYGYRRNHFALPLELLEVAAVLVILHVTPGNPLLPVVGLCFRSLYGGLVLAFARYALWMGALFGAHAGHGAGADGRRPLARHGHQRSRRCSASRFPPRCAPRRSSSAG